MFNSLSPSLTVLKNNKVKRKAALRKSLNTHSFYSIDELFLCVKISYNTVLQNVSTILQCKCCVYLCTDDLFHILLCLWQTYGSMECMYVCM
jgi:hypothetical protein